MTFAGKDQEVAGHVQFVERTVEQVVFQRRDADVVGSADHVRRRTDFVDLEDGGFAVVAVGTSQGVPPRK